MTNCPNNCDNGSVDEFACFTSARQCSGLACGSCYTTHRCEVCNGRGVVCDCGNVLVDEDTKECEDCRNE